MTPKRWAGLSRVVAFAVGVGAVAGILAVRARLFERFSALRERTDGYALPSPEQVVVMSLGHRSALADLIFAHVLVWHGINFEQQRRLEFAADYLDTVSTLDPTFRDTYYFGDTLIAMQPVPPRREDYVRARRLLERGLAARPGDTELWYNAGQFMAYVAAPWLQDPAEQAEWKLAGARVLARACELVGSNENIPYNCIAAAGLLTRAGHREATIQFLERVLAVSDDEEIRRMVLGLLERAFGDRARDRIKARTNLLRNAWRDDLPFISLTQVLALGPRTTPESCAGLGHETSACATSWREWRERTERERPPD